MAARRPSSLCLFCQSRQAGIGRRHSYTTKRRKLGTLASPPSNSTLSLEKKPVVEQTYRLSDVQTTTALEGPVSVGEKLQVDDARHEGNDDVRSALQHLEALWERKEMRVKILRALSNPWPEVKHVKGHNEGRSVARWYLPEDGGPIPHTVFRENLSKAPSEKISRQILRAQLLRCEMPTDILRVVAVAMLKKHTQLDLARLHEPLMRALYRCRQSVNDKEVLRTLTTIFSRLRVYQLPVNPQFVALGLKFAARSRRLKDMKRFLKVFREDNLPMSSNVFRSVIAKCSIGHRGLGEIRNGRWQRQDLIEVLTGFEDCAHLPPERQYHFGAFLDRSDWQYLHGWIAILARCRHIPVIWKEWELWKQSEARINPKSLESMSRSMTSALRGDYWFVEQMTYAGGLKEAWQMLEEADLNFMDLKERIKTRLLNGAEHATVWNEDMRREMKQKYDKDLTNIETALGMHWQSANTKDGSGGEHVLVEGQEEVLERLANADWKLDEEEHGYPYDEPIVPQSEQSLHDAVETAPANATEKRA